MVKQKTFESRIAGFFNKSGFYTGPRELEDSGKKHVSDIVKQQCNSALDVGCGSGTLIFDLLDAGVPRATGIDLSEKMIELSTQHAQEKYGSDQDKVQFIQGSFLDASLDDVDAVSLHRVICCHPDKEGMIDKSVALHPKVITMTIIRDGPLWRVAGALFNFLGSLFRSFHPFVHSQRKIDSLLASRGYQLASRRKYFMWVTSTYHFTQQEEIS